MVRFEGEERDRVARHAIRHPRIARLKAARDGGLPGVDDPHGAQVDDLEHEVTGVAVAVEIRVPLCRLTGAEGNERVAQDEFLRRLAGVDDHSNPNPKVRMITLKMGA